MIQVLAEKAGLGQVALCRDCSDIHLALGTVTLRLSPEAFKALADMLQESLRHPKFFNAQGDPKFFMGSQLFSLV